MNSAHGNLFDELVGKMPTLGGRELSLCVILHEDQPIGLKEEVLPGVPEGDEPTVLHTTVTFLREDEVKPLITALLHLWNDPDFWEFLGGNPQPNSTQVGRWISDRYLTIPTECPSATGWLEMVTTPTKRIAFFTRLLTFNAWEDLMPADGAENDIAQRLIGNAGLRKVVQSSNPLARQFCDLVHLYVEAPAGVALQERMQEILAPRGEVDDRAREVADLLAKDLASFAKSKKKWPRFHLFLKKRAGRQLELKTARKIEEMVQNTIKIENDGQQNFKKPWSQTSERPYAKKADRLLKARGRMTPPSVGQAYEESWLETLYKEESRKII